MNRRAIRDRQELLALLLALLRRGAELGAVTIRVVWDIAAWADSREIQQELPNKDALNAEEDFCVQRLLSRLERDGFGSARNLTIIA